MSDKFHCPKCGQAYNTGGMLSHVCLVPVIGHESALWESTPEMREAMKSPDKQRIEKLEKALREIHWFISNKDGDWYYYMTKDNMLDVISRWVDEALKND